MADTDLKIGLSNVLGVVAPGGLLLAGLTLAGIGIEELFDHHGYRAVLSAVGGKEFLSTTAGLLAAYLLGSAIRLFANDLAEVCSGRYLRHLRGNSSALATQRFPYPIVLDWITADVGTHVFDYLKSKSPTFNREGNKHFFNYCKMIIRDSSPERANYLESIEAFVRFLAGAFVSSTLTFSVSLPLAVAFIARKRFELGLAYGLISLTMLIVIFSVMERFRFQHTREVALTWLAFYDSSTQLQSSRRETE